MKVMGYYRVGIKDLFGVVKSYLIATNDPRDIYTYYKDKKEEVISIERLLDAINVLEKNRSDSCDNTTEDRSVVIRNQMLGLWT